MADVMWYRPFILWVDFYFIEFHGSFDGIDSFGVIFFLALSNIEGVIWYIVYSTYIFLRP